MSDNMKRQPAGIPVGGQFAANDHDEAVSSLSAGRTFQGIPVNEDYEQSPLGLTEIPTVSEDEGLAMRDGESAWHAVSDEEYARYKRYWGDVDDTEVEGNQDSRSAFTVGFLTDESTSGQVEWALDNNATLTVDTDMGMIDLSGDDLREEWDALAPGEGFVIVAVHRQDADESNPYGASNAAIYAASEAGRLFAAGKDAEAAALITEAQSTPERKSDYYAALAAHQPLTEERATRLEALMDDHGVTRGDVDKEIANEFGVIFPYTAPDGNERSFQEHPNRILNRITDDYIVEVVANAARRP